MDKLTEMMLAGSTHNDLWVQAPATILNLNKGELTSEYYPKSNNPKWSFDCGFKLDYDGSLVTVSSRFYTCMNNEKVSNWSGKLSVSFCERQLFEKEFKANDLDELKKLVDNYMLLISHKLTGFLKTLENL